MSGLINYIATMFPTLQIFAQGFITNTASVAAIGWIAKLWADRRIESLKGEQAKELERLKGSQTAQLETLKGEIAALGRRSQASIEQRMLVFKNHFDMEFKAYQEVWSKCDEAVDLAAMTLQYTQRAPITKEYGEEERKDSIRRYDVCREALIEARKRRPFITKPISDAMKAVLVECIHITDEYRHVYKHMTENKDYDRKSYIADTKRRVDALGDQYESLGSMISDRINDLHTDVGREGY